MSRTHWYVWPVIFFLYFLFYFDILVSFGVVNTLLPVFLMMIIFTCVPNPALDCFHLCLPALLGCFIIQGLPPSMWPFKGQLSHIATQRTVPIHRQSKDTLNTHFKCVILFGWLNCTQGHFHTSFPRMLCFWLLLAAQPSSTSPRLPLSVLPVLLCHPVPIRFHTCKSVSFLLLL